MRGKDPALQKSYEFKRITPAHAGKSIADMSETNFGTDHPRTCGEKTFFSSFILDIPGSPPHMRGKGLCCTTMTGMSRITPAHAGKSDADVMQFSRCRDHPRTCGEKIKSNGGSWNTDGSPPHMRGKGPAPSARVCTSWITPAHAGKR